ncbi:uncharacterized protein LOC143449293 [Clavelina lepadiformis]|uniref:uncharacterized protein LOC143449293 n=1 Tax=Clavelina lepadiformis TaxID=159417 RepID=UPI0040435ABF
MADLNTQEILEDIRFATQSGEQDRLYFLLVATPGGAPKAFHNKIIQPFLKDRGWQKVSYRQTGFRALYFLHDKLAENEDAEEHSHSPTKNCKRCTFSSDNIDFATPRKKARKARDSKTTEDNDQDCSTSFNHSVCSECDTWTSTKRASQDRTDLKVTVEEYKKTIGGEFQVHIVLSRPVDYEEDFLEFASQPGAVEE